MHSHILCAGTLKLTNMTVTDKILQWNGTSSRINICKWIRCCQPHMRCDAVKSHDIKYSENCRRLREERD